MTDAHELLHARYLRRRGVRPQTELTRESPRIVRVRRGIYADNELWASLRTADRYQLFVLASVGEMRGAPIICGPSAAAHWGLPTVGAWPGTVHVMIARDGPGSSGNVVRHRVQQLPQPAEVDGVLVTTPARTVIDLARNGTFAAALAAADAALRTNLCTPADLDAELALVPPRGRGRAAAGSVVQLADRRADSPGESLSRARMWELGLPQPSLQVPLLDESGSYGRGDFGWPGVIGEFDGRIKYRADGVAEEQVEQVVWREKLREDRIRRAHRVARWTWDDALRTRPLARILASAGITPVTPPTPWVRGGPSE